MSVCQPSPGVALKEIAKQISDKDKTVRNAALNALVQVYFREGEKLYKYIGTVRGGWWWRQSVVWKAVDGGGVEKSGSRLEVVECGRRWLLCKRVAVE